MTDRAAEIVEAMCAAFYGGEWPGMSQDAKIRAMAMMWPALAAARRLIEAQARAEAKHELAREVYALREDTEERYHEIAQRDLEGKQGAYARGRCVEAKSIAKAIGAILPPLSASPAPRAAKETP